MGDENPGAQAAPATTEAPAKVDPRAAALAMFSNAETHKEAGITAGPKGGAAPDAGASSVGAPSPGQEAQPGTTTAGSGTTGSPPADPSAAPERLSSGFAKLAREKAALLTERQTLQAERAQVKALVELQAKIATDPAAVLDLLKADDRQAALELVAEAYLKAAAGRTEPTAEERLAALEAERAKERTEREARAETDKAAANERAIDEGKKIVAATLQAEKVAAQFPTINGLGEHEQVFDALADYAAKHKIPADKITTDLVLVVAAGVEAALLEEVSGLVSKAPHIAARVATPAKQPTPTGQPTASGAQGTSSTSLASSEVSGAPPPQPGRRYTKAELSAMALQHFNAPA